MNYHRNRSKLDIPENWEDSFGWYYYADIIRYMYDGKTEYYKKRGRQSLVKYCLKCNKQWQTKGNGPGGRKYYEFYEDFPTYKLKRETCIKCIK